MTLITETQLKNATGEKTLSGLVKWCNRNNIPFFKTKNGITTTDAALNHALLGNNINDGFRMDLIK